MTINSRGVRGKEAGWLFDHLSIAIYGLRNILPLYRWNLVVVWIDADYIQIQAMIAGQEGRRCSVV
jgi:hypothetical protein